MKGNPRIRKVIYLEPHIISDLYDYRKEIGCSFSEAVNHALLTSAISTTNRKTQYGKGTHKK